MRHQPGFLGLPEDADACRGLKNKSVIPASSEHESPAAGFPAAREFEFLSLPQAAALLALVAALASMRNFISMPEGG